MILGFSLFMFGFTLWVLVNGRPIGEINRVMASVALTLFLISTAVRSFI